MILRCGKDDIPQVFELINCSAKVYRSVIPAECYHDPYMPLDELQQEMKRITFYGWQEEGSIIGVMGFEPVKDVTLVRHAYIRPDSQRQGIGSALLEHVIRLTRTRRLLVGTWANATWAVNFYKKRGFTLVDNKSGLLENYWKVPQRQVAASVVLELSVKE